MNDFPTPLESLTKEQYDGIVEDRRKELETLSEASKTFKFPGWNLVCSILAEDERICFEGLLKCKLPEQMFHLQGRIESLKSLQHLPQEIEDRQEIITDELKRLRLKIHPEKEGD